MIGLIHKILYKLILTHAGEASLKKILKQAEISETQAFKLHQSYSDVQWRKLLHATCEVLSLSPEQACELFAEGFLKDALERFPVWFQLAHNSMEFLKLQPKIHNHFYASVSDEQARSSAQKKFTIETPSECELIIYYRSSNQLCDLYVALARRIMAYYGDTAEIDRVKCMKYGHENCEIHITWTNFGASAAKGISK